MQALQHTAEHCIYITLTVTTNTLSERVTDPVSAARNSRITELAAQGLSMLAIADALNAEDIRSATGNRVYAKLIGALLSNMRKKERGRHMSSVITMMAEESLP